MYILFVSATWFIALEFTAEPWDDMFNDIYSSKTSMLMNEYEVDIRSRCIIPLLHRLFLDHDVMVYF